MKKREIVAFALIFCILWGLSFASAVFKYYGNDLQKNYRAGENIKGSVNVSFNNEPADSIIKSNFIGNVSLLDLLKKNNFEEDREYKCNTRNCIEGYNTENSASEINIDKEKIIGLKISGGSIDEINFLEFSVESGLSESCESPLEIDILDDGKNILMSNSYKDVSCSSNSYGCFDKQAEQYSSVIIEDFEICETIKVNSAPAYRIGAKITNSTKGKGRLRMTLSNLEGNSASCILPEHTEKEQELDCIVQAIPYQGNYSVCIESMDYTSSGSPNYKIRTENKAPLCGSLGKDFEIFARQLQYDKAKIEVNTGLYEELYGLSLEDDVYDYLLENYDLDDNGNVKCTTQCVIPIKIKGPAQIMKFSDIEFLFRDGGLTVDEDSYKKIYELSVTPVTLTSNPIKINLEPANFIIPFGTKNKTVFQLYLESKLLFEENITVAESFDFSIKPRFAFIGLSTVFEAVSSFNITRSKWDFGDGTIEEVSGAKIRHTYKEAKTYRLKVELFRKDGTSAVKGFDIIAGNPQESANQTLRNYRSRLTNVTRQIDSFPSSLKEPILEILDLGELGATLTELETKFKNASSDANYIEIIDALLDLDVPVSVSITKQGNLPLAVGFDNIDIGYIEEISEKDTEDNNELQRQIVEWMSKHYSSSVSFNVISKFSDRGKEDILTRFILKMTPISETVEDSYLFIDYPFESINFQSNYGQQKIGEGAAAYIPIDEDIGNIEFYLEGEVDVAALGAYISPGIDSFVLQGEEKPICDPNDEKCKIPFPWTRLILWLAALLIITIIGYIMLQEWYKRNYENHLFKNKQDLYNLINFIYNSRVAGLGDSEIKKKLKNSGWTSERINYAFNKIDGRRTGMWEIPIFKTFENRKVRQEIAKRQAGVVDARFIKRPSF